MTQNKKIGLEAGKGEECTEDESVGEQRRKTCRQIEHDPVKGRRGREDADRLTKE
jgi:hypothetical protein